MSDVLVDTSVWVDHFRQANPTLAALLESDRVLVHPMVIGELACGTPPDRMSRVGVIRPPGVGIYRPVEPVPRGVSNDPVEGRYFAGFWGLFEGVFFEAGGTFGSRYERPLSSRQ